MSRRIAVVGSRSIADTETGVDLVKAEMERDWIYYHLDKLINYEDRGFDDYPCSFGVALLSGGAVGVDRRVQEYAEMNDIPFFLYKPYHLIDNKVEYQPRYFFTRNKQIVDNCDELIAFWDLASNGTGDAIRYARKRGKQVTVIEYDERGILEFV